MEVSELEKLFELKQKGIISEEEYNIKKDALLHDDEDETLEWKYYLYGGIIITAILIIIAILIKSHTIAQILGFIISVVWIIIFQIKDNHNSTTE